MYGIVFLPILYTYRYVKKKTAEVGRTTGVKNSHSAYNTCALAQ